jgi:competence ComEA-like helix-hairpin-helix protein
MQGLICKRLILSLLLLISFILNFAIAPPVRAALVDINTAGLEELDTLPGIGPAYAQRIIDYRTANGPFQKIEDIQNVSGIGPSTFANMKDLITVGGASSGNTGANQSGQLDASATQNESTHYSAAPITNTTQTSRVSVGAGRDRVGVVGSPLEFKAEGSKANDRQSMYVWNFGDGTSGNGPLTTHVYEYPGEYVVVLSANLSEGEAIARVNVKIVDSGLSITSASPERIEIKNNSTHEANLFGRALVVGEKVFIFPRDTIIKAGRSISFSYKATGLRPNGLYEVGLIVLGEDRGQKNLVSKVEEEKLRQKEKILGEIHELKERLAAKTRLQIQPSVPEVDTEETPTNSWADYDNLLEASAVRSVSNNNSESWLQTLKRFFLRTKR